MISAHGFRILVTETALELHPDPLAAALSGQSDPTVLPLDRIVSASAEDGDAWDEGTVALTLDKGAEPVLIRFAPGDTDGPDQLCSLIAAAQAGESVGVDAITGFDFVGLDVETANQNWGSICHIGVVRVIDGEITERASWLCRPPERIGHFDEANVRCHGIKPEDVAGEASISERIPQLIDFVGELPVVAHNAYFDASALRYAARAAGAAIPPFTFGCTLAQSRAAQLDVANHKLPTVAESLGVHLERHHDAEQDAAACAEVMVGLARRAEYSGSVADFVRQAGFSMGSIGSDMVTPVLKIYDDPRRSSSASKKAAASRTADASEEANERDTPPKRGPAPWQSVATPDSVPEPALDADPNSPLYGHNVTLTGEFDPYDKGELWNAIAECGGQVGKNVTKKTTILVAGQWATMTTKEKRARELQDNGQDIEIWSAEQLYAALGLND